MLRFFGVLRFADFAASANLFAAYSLFGKRVMRARTLPRRHILFITSGSAGGCGTWDGRRRAVQWNVEILFIRRGVHHVAH